MTKDSRKHLREVSELQGELNQFRYEFSSIDSGSSKAKSISSAKNSRERSLSKGHKVSPRTHKLNDPTRFCGPIATDFKSFADFNSCREPESHKKTKSPLTSAMKENALKKPHIKPSGLRASQIGLPMKERNEHKSDLRQHYDSISSRNDYSTLENPPDIHESPRVSPISKVTIEKRIFNKLQGNNVGEGNKKLEHSLPIKNGFSQCLSKANVFNFISSNSQALVDSCTNSTSILVEKKKGPSGLMLRSSESMANSQESTPISTSKLRRGTLSEKENIPADSYSQRKVKPAIASVHSSSEFEPYQLQKHIGGSKSSRQQAHFVSQSGLKIRLDFKEEACESSVTSTVQRNINVATGQQSHYASREKDFSIHRHRIDSEGFEFSVAKNKLRDEEGAMKSRPSTREVSARLRAKSSDRREVTEVEGKFVNATEFRSVHNEQDSTFTSLDYLKTSPRDMSDPREEGERKSSEHRDLYSEVQQLKAMNVKYAAQIEKLKSQNTNQEKEIEFLKRCKARLEKNLEEMSDMTSKEYIIKIKKLENGLEERENQVKELTMKFEKANSDLQKLTQKSTEEQRVHDEMLKSLRAKITQLENESKNFEQSKKEYSLIENKIQELEEMQNRLLEENSALKKQSDGLKEQNRVLKAQREHENKKKAEEKKSNEKVSGIALHLLQSAHKLKDINGFTGKLLEIVKNVVKGQEPPIELLLKHNRSSQAPKFSEKEQELAMKNMDQLIRETTNILDKVHASFHTCMDTLCDLYAEKYSLDCFVQ